MKYFPLTAGIIIILVGLYLFLNPAVVMASVAWIFALVMLVLGISGLMNHFNRSDRQLVHLIQSIISILFGLILLSSSAWALSSIAITIMAYWLMVTAIVQAVQAYRQRQFGFSAQPAITIALVTFIFAIILFSQPFLSAAIIGRIVAAMIIMAGISTLSIYFRL
ncbi:DUF308 domain-containing protein [Streptococcus dentiloxodontae]